MTRLRSVDAPTPARFWDRRAASYAKSPVPDAAAYERTLERVRAHLTRSDRVLELGCGTGTTALTLAGSVRELVATDYSAEMLAIAAEKARTGGTANVSFRQCTLDEPELEPGSFDVVMAMNLLHLLDDIPARMRRVHELVRPGGLFVSKTQCLGDRAAALRFLIPVMRAAGLAPHVTFVTERSLAEDLGAAGFEIVETGMYPRKTRSYFVVAQRRTA